MGFGKRRRTPSTAALTASTDVHHVEGEARDGKP